MRTYVPRTVAARMSRLTQQHRPKSDEESLGRLCGPGSYLSGSGISAGNSPGTMSRFSGSGMPASISSGGSTRSGEAAGASPAGAGDIGPIGSISVGSRSGEPGLAMSCLHSGADPHQSGHASEGSICACAVGRDHGGRHRPRVAPPHRARRGRCPGLQGRLCRAPYWGLRDGNRVNYANAAASREGMGLAEPPLHPFQGSR
jgi:hypothetical protein